MDLDAAAKLVRDGGVLVFPTETLYALGCAADDATACARVAALKGRPETKPFPLIVADLDGLQAIATDFAAGLPPDLLRLAESFWPGPLSVLVHTRDDLPGFVRDAAGYSSVRVTPHVLARELCLRTGRALVATSANKSGRPATADPTQLDLELVAASDGALLLPPWPAGGAPSTLVCLLGGGRLSVLRSGAVPVEALAQRFSVEPLAAPLAQLPARGLAV
jgi:L-threonylcarbamoyladenylate synthase